MESLSSCDPSNNESIRLEIHQSAQQQYYCPCAENDCGQKSGPHQLKQHITDTHRVPIISFGQPSAVVCLPPRAPIENACLLLHLETVPVWVKLKYLDGEYFIAALMQSCNAAEIDRFYLEVIVSNASGAADRIITKEIVMRSEVHSLESKSWAVSLFFRIN